MTQVYLDTAQVCTFKCSSEPGKVTSKLDKAPQNSLFGGGGGGGSIRTQKQNVSYPGQRLIDKKEYLGMYILGR